MFKNIFIVLQSNTKNVGKVLGTLILIIGLAASSQAQSKQSKKDSVKLRNAEFVKIKEDSIPALFLQKNNTNLNVGANSYIDGKVLEATPASFIFQGLTGRLAGLVTKQNSGIPGDDDLTLTLRGRNPLVLVDGVPRSISELNPEQVESVTVLKDAISTVMLGQRSSMDGAVLITTRRGNASGPDYFNFNVKTQAGFQLPVAKREYLDAFNYATLYNEALANDGRPVAYSPADLAAYQDGSDPFGRPNVDWQKQIFKDNAAFTRTNIFTDGKSKSLRYMASLDYLDQGGLLNESDSNTTNTNSNYTRYILRSNVTIQLTKSLEGYLNLFGRINNTNAPAGGNLVGLASALNLTPNNAYPVYNPNGTLGGNINYNNNLYGRSVSSGYFQTLTREAFFDFGLKQSLDKLTKGLSVGGKLSFSSLTTLTTARSKPFEVVNYNLSATGTPVYTKLVDASAGQVNFSGVTTSGQNSYAEFLAKYNRRFNKNGFDATITANRENYKIFTNGNLPRTVSNYAASLKYDFDEKYIIQGAAAYSGLNYFQEGKQYGFFPAVGLGWNIHKESFMKSVAFVNEFKLRGSYGLTGSFNQGNFNYQRNYITGGNYRFNGAANVLSNGLIEESIPYSNTWSESLKTDIGFDASFVENKLWVSFDYFNHDQRKLPITTGNNTAILGLDYPILFIGTSQIKGLETSIGWASEKAGKFSYSVSANLSTSQTQTVFNDEQIANYASLQRTGFFTNQNFGYQADGFITVAGQGPVLTGYASQPGDLKYKDFNGDNTIDYRDVTTIGEAKPIINYGLNSQINYDKFYFTFLIQGVSNTNDVILGNTVHPFLNGTNGSHTQAFPENLNRWTPQTANTATFPRLSVGGNVNNFANSSFWLRNTSFFRLKNVELGYNISGNFLEKAKIKNVRVFVNGLNLYTNSDFKVFDPEMPTADYGIQKVFNGGLSVTF